MGNVLGVCVAGVPVGVCVFQHPRDVETAFYARDVWMSKCCQLGARANSSSTCPVNLENRVSEYCWIISVQFNFIYTVSKHSNSHSCEIYIGLLCNQAWAKWKCGPKLGITQSPNPNPKKKARRENETVVGYM